MKDVFTYDDYKAYLKDLIASKPKRGRGVRLSLAESIRCPVSHISQVLSGRSHLSMEQAEEVSGFFGHTEEEADFFLLLLQYTRAATPPLKKRLSRQIQAARGKRLNLKERLGVKPHLTLEDQAIFYSSWIYGAVHVMLSIEGFRTQESISRYLGISLKRTSEILGFLVSVGLAVRQENGKFMIGQGRIHLGNDSPMISKFHTNWRMKTIQSLEREDFKDQLHYSSAVTLSDSDFIRIKSLLVQCIEEVKAIVKDSKEEGAHCFSVDFFRL